MPSREPRWIGVFANALALAILLFTGIVLIDLFVDVPSRKVAAQVATAAVLGLAALRIRTLLRGALAGQPRSSFDAATETPPPPAPERARFHQLYDEVRFGARSARYFDLVFWPRLVALAKHPAGPPLEKPRCRSFGRGPSIEALARLIAAIEARR